MNPGKRYIQGIISAGSTISCASTLSAILNVNAGDGSVSVTIGEYEHTKTFTIAKAALTITANAQTITYGESITQGTNQVTAAGLCAGDNMTGVTLTASTTDVPGGTITPSGAEIKNVSSEIVTGNYDISYADGTLTINKANVTITTPPVARTLTYSGAAQALVSPGAANVGQVVYSLEENGSYSENIPTGTNAGAYTVWYKVEDTANYNGTVLTRLSRLPAPRPARPRASTAKSAARLF